MRKTWETIKQLLNKNYKQLEFPSTYKINGVNIFDKKEIAQQFHNLFLYISAVNWLKPYRPNINLNLLIVTSDVFPHFNFVPVTRDEVISIIHKFAPKKSAGHDLISTNLLKEISPLIAEPLSLIINQSLSTGIFPSK